MNQPLLTIGIIFKNEIRCLERCLEALCPLRTAIPCELIMADTGSSDGSREIAARHADVLFDFPWIDDFSAARNAIMEKASGTWYLTIDSDEYLDENISELTDFLKKSSKQPENLCMIVQRNYETFEMDSRYSDLMAARLLRMSTGARYQGTIHESWTVGEKELQNIRVLRQTILHHDGYVELEQEYGREKRERNLKLLQKKLMRDPKDLRTLLQYIESGKDEPDYLDILWRACSEIQDKHIYWQYFGAPIFRYAVRTALEKGLPEFKEWVARAEEWFPNSPFTQIDVEYMAFIFSMKHGDYSDSIQRGERYLNAMKDLSENMQMLAALAYSTLLAGSYYWEQEVKIYLADIYIKEGAPKRGRELLMEIDGTLLDAQQTRTMLFALGDLQRLSQLDTSKVLQKFFRDINVSRPSDKMAQERISTFYQNARLAFLIENRQEELQEKGFFRPSYTLFLSLERECELNIAARMLQTKNATELQQLLLKVKSWENFPIEALAHALMHGLSFPLSEYPLKSEDMERLVTRLSEDRESFLSIVGYTARKEGVSIKSLQELTWLQFVSLTAIHIYDWKNSLKEDGTEIARFFAKTMAEYLSHFYTAEILCEKNLSLLPSLHRFSWYCARAFDALDSEDIPAYVRELKAGLEACPEVNVIVEYLIKHTHQLAPRQQEASDELLGLATQVKNLLSEYPPDHPAVVAIKASEAYQKVAKLLEDENL